MRRPLLMLFAALALAAPGPHALADNPQINVQLFRPATHPGDLFNVLSSDVHGHLSYQVGAFFSYGHDPLVFVDLDSAGEEEVRHAVIAEQLTMDITASLSLFEWVDVGLAIPVHLVNMGQADGFLYQGGGPSLLSPVAAAALGDIRLAPKLRLLRRELGEDGVGVALETVFILPSGLANPDAFVTDGFAFEATAIADYRHGPFLATLNVGARLRGDADVFEGATYFTASHQMTYGLGASYEVVEDLLSVTGELHGATSSFTDIHEAQLEGLLGAQIVLPDLGLGFSVGAGAGMLSGYGNAQYRIFAGVTYNGAFILDSDDDGLDDDVDRCPEAPEDVDGFADEDGCPDIDNDEDSVLDDDDRCPLDPEDLDGFEDADGCPDADNDRDGVPDVRDGCPMEMEDSDGFEDADGCPDPDNDLDGFADDEDRCPDASEVVNGLDDEDGCPDETLARIEDRLIFTARPITFGRRARLDQEGKAILDDVARLLAAVPLIESLRVVVVMDGRGSAKRLKRTSQRHADAITRYLVAAGIDVERLVGAGMGAVTPTTRRGKALPLVKLVISGW